jgi:hypothetical protein
MLFSGMLRRVPLVRTKVLEECIASISVKGIDDLGTTLAVTSVLMKCYQEPKTEPTPCMKSIPYVRRRLRNVLGLGETFQNLQVKS